MKREKTKMSISAQAFWMSIVIGIFWVCIGIVGMFDRFVLDIVRYTLMVISGLVLIVILKANREEEDEMSEYNYIMAKAETTRVMHYVYCGAAIFSSAVFSLLQNADIYWAKVILNIFFVLMGIQDIITGIILCRLEKE